MFVGHYAASFAGKAAEPRAPLWSYFIAAQLLDVGWGALVIAGIEKVRIDPNLPGSVFDLYYMPWTHSLPAAILWSIGGALLFKALLKLPDHAAVVLGLVVLSHWILDFLVHRPDLLLWPGGPKVGLGLWNFPVPEQAVEIGLLAIGAVLWTAYRVRNGQPILAAVLLVTVLVCAQVAVILMPPSGRASLIGWSVLGAYAALAFAAWLAERSDAKPVSLAQ